MTMFTSFPRGLTAIALAGALTLSACDSVEPGDGPGEQEFITEVTLTLTNAADANDFVTITGIDPEQDGLVFDPASIALTPGVTYIGTVEYNDTINNEEITEEIQQEAEDHRIAWSFDNGAAGTITVTDVESDYVMGDSNGGDYLVGLEFTVEVAAGATGATNLRAILYHFDPDDGETKDSSTDTSDEIDIEVPFPVTFN